MAFVVGAGSLVAISVAVESNVAGKTRGKVNKALVDLFLVPLVGERKQRSE